MQFTYKSSDGDSTYYTFPANAIITGESRNGDPEDAPTLWNVRLNVKFVFLKDTYNANRDEYLALYNVIRNNPSGKLKWTSSGITYLDHPVTILSHDLPDSPNSIGTYRQEVNVTFGYVEYIDDPNRLGADETNSIYFQRGGAGRPKTNLGIILKWKEDISNQRYSTFSSKRSQSIGKVTASGRIQYDGPSSTNTSTKRAAMLVVKDKLINEVNCRDGILKYGSAFNGSTGRTVKIDEFSADIDDARNFINWSMTATYNTFPNGAWSAIEFSKSISTDYDTGDQVLSLSGRIGASTEGAATDKLSAIRKAELIAAGYMTAGEVLTSECTKQSSDAKKVSVSPVTGASYSNTATNTAAANSDDDTNPAVDNKEFIELNFNEEYKKKSTTILSWNVKTSESVDTKAGTKTITYSGTVTAGGRVPNDSTGVYDYSAAYARAYEKAQNLGAVAGLASFAKTTPYQFLMSSSLNAEYGKKEGTGGPYEVSTTQFVRLDFSYTYALRNDRLYFEVQSSRKTEYLGEDTEEVSGVITAKDADTASTTLDYILSTYGSNLVRNLSRNTSMVYIQKNNSVTAVATGESDKEVGTDPATTVVEQYQQETFSFSVVYPKESGHITARIGMDTSADLVSLSASTSISGTVFATSKAAALTWLGFSEQWISGTLSIAKLDTGKQKEWSDQYGTLLSYTVKQSSETLPTASTARTEGGATTGDIQLPGYDFTMTFEGRITGDDAILETELTEDITFSGTRHVEQAIPDGPSVVQQCGTTIATRTISGSVTAATETLCWKWLKCIKAAKSDGTIDLPFYAYAPADNTPNSTRYHQPANVKTSWKWVPRFFGEAETNYAYTAASTRIGPDCDSGPFNQCKVCSLSFTMSEIIPDFQIDTQFIA